MAGFFTLLLDVNVVICIILGIIALGLCLTSHTVTEAPTKDAVAEKEAAREMPRKVAGSKGVLAAPLMGWKFAEGASYGDGADSSVSTVDTMRGSGHSTTVSRRTTSTKTKSMLCDSFQLGMPMSKAPKRGWVSLADLRGEGAPIFVGSPTSVRSQSSSSARSSDSMHVEFNGRSVPRNGAGGIHDLQSLLRPRSQAA
mmetsp:Transcript_49145/g.114935  ORF Transcript_49145/g.114935 Transcript_49145/m.114935 type:complete len:198 (-) Transcript_49145:172-765(-)